MGTLLLHRIKRQASSFLQEKYKTARLALTDVTPTELLAEEATNDDPWGPDARTMTQIAAASFEIDGYWRICDILHWRLGTVDWKQWRQSYKSLVLLEFLLTHGPVDFVEDFQCDSDIIKELGTFKHIDQKGFDWGANMQKKSESILALLRGGEALQEARLKALKITKEIQGFGSPILSSYSSSSPSSSSRASRTSSFGSYCSSGSTWNDINNELNKLERISSPKESMGYYSQGGIQDTYQVNNNDAEGEGSHIWDCPQIDESGSLIEPEDDEDAKTGGLISKICSKLVGGISPLQKCKGEKVAFSKFI
ncbi:ENTH domain-containing protein [Cephalotus follicularis]|uniref:ENTH domain-containing protein n=1 Tax=Cephalotus follicularis TaxID=3775 RepID=A0A1Q3BQC4_CEPFO|nr:ENTH domain-containing protein [Cephalotus follicularis]